MKQFVKVYVWLTGILIAFMGSYLTGIMSELIPPPKQFLCKLSLGFCAQPILISFTATEIDRIVDRDGVGQGVGQNQIGMLHNRTDPNIERSNMVKYQFDTSHSGSYQFRAFYASANSRPVKVFINDALIDPSALKNLTGGWDNDDRLWSNLYIVQLEKGKNTLMLKRESYFPHLSKFEFKEIR